MRFMDINKKLKEKVENVYVLKGNDPFLIRQAIINIKAATVLNYEELNYQRVDGEKIKTNELNAILSTLPLANDYRLVVIDNPNPEVIKYINKYEFYNGLVLILVGAEKVKLGEEIDCTKLDRQDLTKYILAQLKKYNLNIQESALDYLINATDGSMASIVNELSKITAYCVDNDIVTLDIVTNLVSNSTEYVTYMLTNAIDNKDYSKYEQILNDMTKSLTYNEIFAYMGKFFKRMFYVSISKNDDELAKILNLKPYAIKMSRNSITKNGIKYYINLYENYINLDYKIKSGKLTAKSALYQLIF